MRKGDFRGVKVDAPSGQAGLAHLSISDASGDSAIFEFVGGKLEIHHSRDYQVMTNEPTFEQQLSLTNYWKEIGGPAFMPGINRASDRFVRASYYVNSTTQTADPRAAAATVFSIMRNVSVPKGITTPGRPNVADTLWLTVSDQKNKVPISRTRTAPARSGSISPSSTSARARACACCSSTATPTFRATRAPTSSRRSCSSSWQRTERRLRERGVRGRRNPGAGRAAVSAQCSDGRLRLPVVAPARDRRALEGL